MRSTFFAKVLHPAGMWTVVLILGLVVMPVLLAVSQRSASADYHCVCGHPLERLEHRELYLCEACARVYASSSSGPRLMHDTELEQLEPTLRRELIRLRAACLGLQ